MEEQVALMETLEPSTQFKGKIDLKTPQNVFWLLMTPGTHGVHGVPQMDAQYYFGREVGTTDRSVISKYDLRYRRYLGPTSMDTEMAFIMCNIGKVAKNRLVLDPFVGTGSILIAAAHAGALTLGTDIDMRVIKLGKKDSKGRAVNLYTNFADYGLQSPVGLLRSDAHRPPFRSDLAEIFDAVVCDPPYGVRAGGRKGGQRDYTPKDRQSHYVSTDAYPLGECLADLLESSARLLRVGGRLVYFLPAMAGYYDPAEIPTHPMLRMVSNSEQFLSRKYSRRLVAMEKAAPYDAAAAAAHRAACGKPAMLIDHLHQHVYQGTLPQGKSAS
ncbi:hypothetical protein H632_c279p2 [Helicosporidium sp. ATCC 50920]|nr:hypothetical protein H632_c279p2 [Helicosporidium sp. ATCC 50920]|eukprot:KDD76297.1 hypothetical protein H632_c279p2 [Helicosporidium sp. ATCC 50920]